MTNPTDNTTNSAESAGANVPELSKSQADEGAALGRASSFSLDVERKTTIDALRGWWNNVRSGEPGALPAILGLVVLAIIFAQVSGEFFTQYNIGNLPGQAAYISIIAMGLIFVLLLGEIDLSGGTTGGMCAGFAVQILVGGNLKDGVPGGLYWAVLVFMLAMAVLGFFLRSITGPVIVVVGVLIGFFGLGSGSELVAMIFAVAAGCAVGIFVGWLVAVVRIPSFIVTLALFLAFQGVLLFALQSQPKKVNDYNLFNKLANANLSPTASWIFTIVVVGGFVAFTLVRALLSIRKRVAGEGIDLVLVRGAVVAIIAVLITIAANDNRNPLPFGTLEGIPYAAAVPIVLMILVTTVLNHTSWGRHLYATGGNAEAARRAGINVTHIRVTAFTMSSGFAALGGLFLASSVGAVTLALGGANVLLFSVAAAVIGGTSLFGGRGKPRDALLGALVIAIIPNGIGLRPDLGPEYQYVVTGLVLLVAASVDALSRRRARTA